jgi:hypothetical protein
MSSSSTFIKSTPKSLVLKSPRELLLEPQVNLESSMALLEDPKLTCLWFQYATHLWLGSWASMDWKSGINVRCQLKNDIDILKNHEFALPEQWMAKRIQTFYDRWCFAVVPRGACLVHRDSCADWFHNLVCQ